jgi:hypothetical protein
MASATTTIAINLWRIKVSIDEILLICETGKVSLILTG